MIGKNILKNVKQMSLILVLFAVLAFSGCSSDSSINLGTSQIDSSNLVDSQEESTSINPQEEVEQVLDEELLSDTDDVEIGQLI